jgi:hypothetical protein
MVWPILISVTPRISAAEEVAGSATTATAPVAASLLVKRMRVFLRFADGNNDRRTSDHCPIIVDW